MTNPLYAVELIEVSKTFPGSKGRTALAVDRLNLAIELGEFFSLLGPSGCGKTTTLRMIAGFETPTQGMIKIGGEVMHDRPPFHRPVNTVFQNYALFPHLTVAQNVAFGLEMDDRPRAAIQPAVEAALSQVQLDKFAHRYPRQLSGGQQQRVALARALVKQPQVLLLDEPLGALDLKLRKEMQLELKQMQQQVGITFIYVTHDQEEALTMSDRIAVMDQGQILQMGSPIEIYEYPATPFVATFMGESNLLKGRVTERWGDLTVVLVEEQLVVRVHSTTDVSVGQGVTVVIRPEKFTLTTRESLGHQHWPGAIEAVTYIGTDTRYRVRLTSQVVVTVRMQNLHLSDLQRFSPGESLTVSVPADSIRILDGV